jgi:hypothetical protein
MLYVVLCEWKAMNNELGSMWREVAMVYFKALLQHVLQETRKYFRIISFQIQN